MIMRMIISGVNEMKNIATIMLIILICIMMTCHTSATSVATFSENVSVVINGNMVVFTEQLPIVMNGEVLAPARLIADYLDFTLNWYDTLLDFKHVLTLKRGQKTISFGDGTRIMNISIDGQSYKPRLMEVASIVQNGSILVPLKYWAEEFEISYEWNAPTNTVYLFDSYLPRVNYTKFEPAVVSIDINDLAYECSYICAELGILLGEGDGVTPEYLLKESTRVQAAYLTIRLVGKESEAESYNGTDNFVDVVGNIYPGGERRTAYLKAHSKKYGWQGDGTGKLMPNERITPQEFYKVLLTVLGYVANIDYAYEDTLSFAARITNMKERRSSDTLINNDLSVMIVEALLAKVYGKTYTLAEYLADEGIINRQRAVELGVIDNYYEDEHNEGEPNEEELAQALGISQSSSPEPTTAPQATPLSSYKTAQYLNGIYEGYWENELPNGIGKLTRTNGDWEEGEFKNGIFISGKIKHTFEDSSYEGEWENGIMNGRGIMIWDGGDFYDGDWKDGKFSGKGKMVWPDHWYEGEWYDGKRNGKGIETWEDGGYCDGDWLDDSRNGKCTIVWPNLGCYVGDIVNSLRHGYGKMIWYAEGWEDGDGGWEEGEWINDILWNGEGEYYYSSYTWHFNVINGNSTGY